MFVYASVLFLVIVCRVLCVARIVSCSVYNDVYGVPCTVCRVLCGMCCMLCSVSGVCCMLYAV